MEVIYYPFVHDIIGESLGHVSDLTVLVYPTHSSARESAKRYYNPDPSKAPLWGLERVDFITMEELKKRMLLSDTPILEDEKRLLCLYYVLSEEDKEVFHINGYDDLIGWGQHWFGFFDELCEEQISAQSLLTLAENSAFYLQVWQEEYIERILDIRDRYREYITSCGFTDAIFAFEASTARIPPLYRRYVFVNQYYYSALETALIAKLESDGCEIKCLYHGSKEWFATGISRDDISSVLASGEYNTTSLEIVLGKSEEQMIAGILQRHQSDPETCSDAAVIDRLFFHKPYHRFFDPGLYGFANQHKLSDSKLYQMFGLILNHQKELIRDGASTYLPLRLLHNAISQPWFFEYFAADGDSLLVLRRELDKLIQDDYLYVDMELKLFQIIPYPENYTHLQQFCLAYFELLKSFCRIESIPALISMLDEKGGIVWDRLIPDELASSPDLRRVLWERTANFAAITEMKIIPSWEAIFGSEPFAVSSGILSLYLSFIKTAKYSYPRQESVPCKYHITNLMDSRNKSYDRIDFLNVIEGEIPSKPSPVWLLNETQRMRLGLKTWDDIRQWERYYFYRLIFSCKEVRIFAYQSPENNIEAGSLIGELLRRLEEHPEHSIERLCITNESYPAGLFIASRYNSERRDEHLKTQPERDYSDLANPVICIREKIPNEGFFCMPYSKGEDFGEENLINSNYYDITAFVKNPFAWYITGLRKIEGNSMQRLESINRKVFGTILHSFVAKVLNDYIVKYPDRLVADKSFTQREYLHKELMLILEDPLYSFKIPKNYNREFLQGVMADSLCAAIRWVFERVLYADPNLLGQATRIIPEQDRFSKDERRKVLIKPESNPDQIQIKILGKADLRIETPTARYIIDFKTGNGSQDQLALYEYYYYLLDSEVERDYSLVSMICNMLERTLNSYKDQDEYRQKLLDQIHGQVINVIGNGYRIPLKVAERKTLENISRADLFKRKTWSENE